MYILTEAKVYIYLQQRNKTKFVQYCYSVLLSSQQNSDKHNQLQVNLTNQAR